MPHDTSALVRYRIDRAQETILEAELALNNDMLQLAANRIYYAIFYITSALAAKYKYSTSKHSQLKGWFNKNFIKTGKLPKQLGEIYELAFVNRQESDYDDFVSLNREELLQQFNEMKQFVAQIEVELKA